MSKSESEKLTENLNPKFESAVFFVANVQKSKDFYVNILGQKIVMDFGRNVGFEGGFAIWESEYALNTIFEKKSKNVKIGSNNTELYFEFGDLDGLFQKLEEEGVKIIHSIREHPWGQRGFRFYDPDNHIIEISEPMFNVVARMYKEGFKIGEIEEKSMMPKEFINMVIDSLKKSS